MRFTDDTIPPAPPVVDATEVSPKAAVSAIRRIGDGTRGTSLQVGGGRQEVEEAAERHEVLIREDEDRRKMCRRIYHLPVLLDTRSGEDRRKENRRPDDTVTHMDREV